MTARKVDIAISFAGEDRQLAKEIADKLTTRGVSVFYDEYAQADLWGKDLYVHLSHVYRDGAKFCLMLISNHYANKQWTNHERKAAQARAFRENEEYILPLRLDDAQIEGVLETTGFIDLRKVGIEKVITMIENKVGAYNEVHGITAKIVKAEEALGRLRLPDGRAVCDSDLKTRCPTCEHPQTLAEARISLDGSDTIYTCINGCHAIAVISRPGLSAWPGRGYCMGTHVIRNASDVIIKTERMHTPVLIPASKAALMKSKPPSTK